MGGSVKWIQHRSQHFRDGETEAQAGEQPAAPGSSIEGLIPPTLSPAGFFLYL